MKILIGKSLELFSVEEMCQEKENIKSWISFVKELNKIFLIKTANIVYTELMLI
jgi:hypothetical protein